jgi:amidohydrolase
MSGIDHHHIFLLKEKSRDILNEAIKIRREIHRNPELSYFEHQTADYIANFLKLSAIPFKTGIAGTGIIAVVEGGLGEGPVIGLRAELDALPITEQNVSDYTSKNSGVMHACGHDAHMAMVLASAKILNEINHLFKGKFIFIFQPGEELAPGGASLVLEHGYLRSLQPSVIIAQHTLPEMIAGNIGFKGGKYMASSDEIYINIKGTGGHAALKGLSTDQIRIASELVVNLKEKADSLETDLPLVLGIGRFIASGATNVIPETVHIEGTLRTFDERTREIFHSVIRDTCTEVATKYGVSIDPEIRKGYPVLTTDVKLTEKAQSVAKMVLGDNRVEELPLRMSSEDFAFYSLEFPVIFYRLGVKSPETEPRNLHTPTFDIDESAMETGILILCSLAIEMANTL